MAERARKSEGRERLAAGRSVVGPRAGGVGRFVEVIREFRGVTRGIGVHVRLEGVADRAMQHTPLALQQLSKYGVAGERMSERVALVRAVIIFVLDQLRLDRDAQRKDELSFGG